jgi:hypothetical protein
MVYNMVERLSAKEFFKQMLAGHAEKVGIDFYNFDPELVETRVGRNSLTISFPGGHALKFKDAALVKAAKLASLEETTPEPEQKKREEILLELYGKNVVYGGEMANWKKFQLDHAFKGTPGLQHQLEEVDARNNVYLSRFKEHLGNRIYGMLSNKVPYAMFEDTLTDMSNEEALRLLRHVSMRSHPAVNFVEVNGGRKIMVPYIGIQDDDIYTLE